MTTEDKKQALLDAGIKIRANASEETVEAAWEEFQKEQEESSAFTEADHDAAVEALADAEEAGTFEGDPVQIDEVTGDPIPPIHPLQQPVTQPAPVVETVANGETIHDVIARVGNKRLGDRDPEVVAWARKNLSEFDFEARYGGRDLTV